MDEKDPWHKPPPAWRWAQPDTRSGLPGSPLGEDSHVLGSCLRELCGPSPVALNHSPYPLWYFQQLTQLINSTFIRQTACLLPQTNTWTFLAKKPWADSTLRSIPPFWARHCLSLSLAGWWLQPLPVRATPAPTVPEGSLAGRCLLVLRTEAGVPGSIPWQHCPENRRLGTVLSPTADNSSHSAGRGEERSPMFPWSTCRAGSSINRSIRCASCACSLWLHCLYCLSLQQPEERN